MNDRARWLEERRLGIGGSDAAPALGLSKWSTPLQLYLDKIGEGELLEETDPMRFGHLLEPIVRDEYSRRTGREVVFGQPPLVSREYPWMRVNLDGFVHADNRVFEAKTARNDQGWGDPGTDDVPQDYILQCTHAMIVTGAKVADVAVLIGGSDFRIYTVERNAALVDLVIAGERAFWDAVQRREPPAPTTLAEINLRWRESRPVMRELPPNVAAACQRLAELKAQIKASEAEADKLEGIVKFEMGDADTATVDGVPVATWKQAKASRVFDAKAFREARPEIAREYEVEKPGSRRFLLKL